MGQIGSPGPGCGLGVPASLHARPKGLAGPPARGWPHSQPYFFSSDIFFIILEIRISKTEKEIRKIARKFRKVQNYIFLVIENFRDIYGLFLFRCVLWYFIYILCNFSS
jgi:hypothetical protein